MEEAFSCAELDWKKFVETDPRYFRPTEVDLFIGDATKAWRKLGWELKVSFKSLVRMMVDADVEAVRRNTDSSGLSMTYETNDSHMWEGDGSR